MVPSVGPFCRLSLSETSVPPKPAARYSQVHFPFISLFPVEALTCLIGTIITDDARGRKKDNEGRNSVEMMIKKKKKLRRNDIFETFVTVFPAKKKMFGPGDTYLFI